MIDIINNKLPAINWNKEKSEVSIEYNKKEIFKAKLKVNSEDELPLDIRIVWDYESRIADSVFLGYPYTLAYSSNTNISMQAVSLVVCITPVFYTNTISMDADIFASEDSFACTPKSDDKIVRSFFGKSNSLSNNGVYDRHNDWCLYIDKSSENLVFQQNDSHYKIQAYGEEITLKLDIDFYKTHRGFYYFDPNKKLWKKPVSGWCSWASHFCNITEKDVLEISELFSKELKAFGWDIIQIDDGYQLFNQNNPLPLESGKSVADYWTSCIKEKFPNGLAYTAKKISELGLTPGIWISVALPEGMQDEYYLKDDEGKLIREKFVAYAIDGNNDDAVNDAFVKTIKGLKDQGWSYFKIDTLRHLLYDHYRRHPNYWESRNVSSDEAFRNIFRKIKEAASEDIYVMACWGVLPELADIADGCRIGEDIGAEYNSLIKAERYISRFQYLNNIIWRNDPDYMCMRIELEYARTWATIIALTGGQLMVSDSAEFYDVDRLDIMKKVGPPLFIRPSILDQIGNNNELFTLEIDKPYEHWLVAARAAWSEDNLSKKEIKFSELGLSTDKEYLVFDFWNEKFIGVFSKSFNSESLNIGECRVYGIREYQKHPQILATNRHITMGAVELENVKWDKNTLSGDFILPDSREYILYLYIPNGFIIKDSNVEYSISNNITALNISSETDKRKEWKIVFG
ncbi:MAG: hypothetical protein SNJ70_08220 [Armatimonadota bacterium]